MSNVELREVLACPRIDELPIPPTPSFNCECQLCGTRVWVAYNSPIEPVRMCVACSAAHDAKIQRAALGDRGSGST
jgi:predicted nucleic acid-binding Zn ribbon protein